MSFSTRTRRVPAGRLVAGRLSHSTGGNNSDTAVCGVRRRRVGSPKAATAARRRRRGPPHYAGPVSRHTGSFMRRRRRNRRGRRRRRHTRDWQIGAPTVRRSDWSTAARLRRTDPRAHARGAGPARTRPRAYAHTHAYVRRTRARGARTSPAASEVVGFRCVRSSESVHSVLFHSPPNADRRRSRKLR